MRKGNIQVLFTGYAYVHFVCFRSLYRYLNLRSDVDLFVSGGLRTRDGNRYLYDARKMYRIFGVNQARILSVDQIKKRHFDLLFAANTNMILPGNAKTRIQIFHGVSFRNRAVRPKHCRCDYYFLTGPYMHRLFVKAGLLDKNDPRAVPLGFMKTDRLLNGELDRKSLLTQYGLTGQRPVLLYAPTGLQKNSLEIMGDEVVKGICAADKYDLLIKLHDHSKNNDIDWTRRLKPCLGAHCQIVSDKDVIPLLYLSDLLITDASSVSNEYTLLDRPIVFLDVPELLTLAKMQEHSLMDLKTWGRKSGIIVKNPQKVAESIEYSLMNPHEYSEIRQAMARDLFYNPGQATPAAISWLEKKYLCPKK